MSYASHELIWRESATGPLSLDLVTTRGVKVGSVYQQGGSWVCVHDREIIAMRPDEASARAVVEKLATAAK